MPQDNNWQPPWDRPQQPPQSQPQQPAQPTQPQPQQPQQPQVQVSSQQQPQPAYAQPAYVQAAYEQPAYGQSTPPQVVVQAPKKSHGWIVALVAVVLLFVLMFAGLASCTSAVNSLGLMGSSVASSSETDYLFEDAVGVITLDDTIEYDGSVCSPEGFKEQLDIAAENDYIVAVVLRVNSGGGTATAGEEMATYLKEFSEETGKPVVVSSASTNASAAYEISSQADYIYVAKSTSIGAIGTAMQITDLSGLYDLLGINIENITSADSKDSTYGTRALTDEERAYYQAMVDQINETFIQTVAEGRGMDAEEVRALATGLTFTGLDAVDNGLADEVGTLEDAVEKAAKLAGVETCETVSLEQSGSDISSLMGLLSSAQSEEELAELLNEWEDDGEITQ